MTEPIVRFEGVRKSYDGKSLAVRGLDLAIARGEFLTLLGPSGSGKTTTLMMLAGFEAPTAGRILLDGRDVAGVPPYRRGLGMVFQSYALFPHLSVGENVAFPLDVRRIARAERDARVARALDMVRLGALGARRPAQLSGGQQQRVALARALVHEPMLILLDEPLGALDKQLREEMQYELKRLHRTLGVTMVYVTHDQEEALTLSDRIAVFADGAVRQLADPKTLYDRPENAFVAGFVGENNRIEAVVEATEPGACTVRVGEHVLRARDVEGLAPGEAAILSLRPERLRLDGDPIVEGVVEELLYVGDHLRVRLAALGRDDVVAKVTGDAAPERGRRVGLAWRDGDLLAFRADRAP